VGFHASRHAVRPAPARNRQIALKSQAVARFFVSIQMLKRRLAVQTRQHLGDLTGNHLQLPADFA
jgi:hypothetical protein